MAVQGPNLAQTQNGTEVNAPKVVNTGDAPVSGGPTTPSLSRGLIGNTAIAISNADIAHVCDVSGEIRFEIAKATIAVTGAINTLREEMQALWAGSSASGFSDEVRNEAKTIQNKINELKKFVNDQTEPLKDVQKYAQELQELTIAIARLPVRIAEQLKKCLSNVASGINESIALGKSIEAQVLDGTISKANIDIILQEAIAANAQNELVTTNNIQKP